MARPKTGQTPIRSVRVPEDAWEALRAYAADKDETRTEVLMEWMRTLIPNIFWPKHEVPRQITLEEVLADYAEEDARNDADR